MSSTEELRTPASYADIASLRGDLVLFFRQFGSYQGEWVLFSLSLENSCYRLWRDWYGSCSGCDSLQAASFHTQKDVDEFVFGYQAFAEIPRSTAAKLAANGIFAQVFPANYREDYSDISVDELVAEIETIVKLEEDLPVTFGDARRAMSQETRRRVLERLDVEELISETIDTDGPDKLVRIEVEGDIEIYLWLQDASTPRRYLLRVPPEMLRVRQAKAWSFGVEEAEYAPLRET